MGLFSHDNTGLLLELICIQVLGQFLAMVKGLLMRTRGPIRKPAKRGRTPLVYLCRARASSQKSLSCSLLIDQTASANNRENSLKLHP